MPRLRVNVRSFCVPLQLAYLVCVSLFWLGQTATGQVNSSSTNSPSLMQGQVAAPERFERILWCADSKAGPKLARKSGYSAVQLGRGGDAAPLRALGLRFYLDQPIGKGLLELRAAEWQPVKQLFERTRDASQLVRPKCFAEPGVVDQAAAAAAKEARRVGADGMLFVALADEASSTRHNAPLDSCQCEHCIDDFLQIHES